MVVQIGGIVILTISIICGTWYAVTVRQMQIKAEQARTDKRNAHYERMNIGNWSALYEDERQRRIDAETREQIAKDQLRRAREQMATMMIKEVK